MKIKYLIFVLIAFAQNIYSQSTDAIIFTANQDFLSRIYVLKMDGTVHNYFQYDFYRFVDMEVVNNELYANDAFAPRMYKVDPNTGDLDLIIDDWSLFYFYGLAFDGTYFYVDEWDLNRYDTNGNYNGTASFSEEVYGSAWDGINFWTLGDENIIKCWDISNWPTVTALPDSNFVPPSDSCRGLWYDGEYYWSAESGATVGKIYKFNRNGNIVQQWNEPAFSGWSACVIEDFFPSTPEINVISPNGGEHWMMSEIRDILWSSNDIDSVKIELSLHDGLLWHTIAESTPSDGQYEWLVQAPQTSFDCKIHITDLADSIIADSSDDTFVIDIFPSVDDSSNIGIPNEYILYQNFPNPFNPTTKIIFNIATTGFTSLKVYDVLGNEVATLANEDKSAGEYEIEFYANELTSGVYFYQLKAGSYTQTKMMVLIK